MTNIAYQTTAKPRRRNAVDLLHAGALGDCVLAIHVGRALRAAGCEVTVIARSAIAAWAARRGLIDRFIWLDRVQWLWKGDAAIDLPGDGRNTDPLLSSDLVISFLGGAEESIARSLNRRFGPGRVIHIDPKLRDETKLAGIHITRQWTNDIRTQLTSQPRSSGQAKCERAIWPPDRFVIVEGARLEQAVKPATVLVHPGSGGREKCCSIAALEAVVAELKIRDVPVRWMIGPDELERDGPKLRQRLERTCEVVFQESIERAADTVAAAGAFLGNDSGMTHVAALTGIRTVALFGPTDPRIWQPIGTNVSILPFPSVDLSLNAWVASVCKALT